MPSASPSPATRPRLPIWPIWRPGGLGFFVGDGRITPAAERIVEAFYRFAVTDGVWISLGRQHIANPGYNADRGPVAVTMLRLHRAR